MKKKWALLSLFISLCGPSCGHTEKTVLDSVSSEEVLALIKRVNNHWIETHPVHGNAFWHRAAYHTGNMEAYRLTGDETFRAYSEAWAERNQWQGARSDDKSKWKCSYGETDDYVLFGDWQICFQTYIDLYLLEGAQDPSKITRAREVMDYQIATGKNDYWWWADGLYMVMPVMTKLYRITSDQTYLFKMDEWLGYADSLMWDCESHLYYRDAKYVYPNHKSLNGRKDFWARGTGWVFAALAKVLPDIPEDHPSRPQYVQRFRELAAAIASCQQPEGHWTRSMLDPDHAPGYETSGTAFFTYGFFWGINQGVLDAADYLPVAERAWIYLAQTALQPDGSVGFVQPIGEKAIPGQVVDQSSTSDFGVGAFLLAGCELTRWLKNREGIPVTDRLEQMYHTASK